MDDFNTEYSYLTFSKYIYIYYYLKNFTYSDFFFFFFERKMTIYSLTFFLVSLPVGFYPMCRQMVQVITPPVNKGFLKIPSSINNYYRSNMSRRQLQRPFHLFAVFLFMPDMYRRNFKRLHRLCKLVSLFLMAHVYPPMQMLFVKGRVLSLTTISGNLMVSSTVQISFIY